MRWVVLVVAFGCNQVYGLDETQPIPADPDGDFIFASDNCPLESNPTQDDADADDVGDACDLCPADFGPTNHDEDDDLQGDLCDRCPSIPDFDDDTDNDGVPNPCDAQIGIRSQQLLFDSFETLDETRWQALGGAWQSLGDSIVMTDPPAANDPGLRSTIVLDSYFWNAHISIFAQRPYRDGDSIGIRIVDATGKLVVRCGIDCNPMYCSQVLEMPSSKRTSGINALRPSSLLQLSVEQHPTMFGASAFVCRLDTSMIVDVATGLPQHGTLTLFGNNELEIRFAAAWEHNLGVL